MKIIIKIAFILLQLFIISCNTKSKKLKVHFNENMLTRALEIVNTDSLVKAENFVDSIRSTFPYISVADQYQFYYFKAKFFSNEHFKPKDYLKAHLYADSMALLIETNNLQNDMNEEYAEVFNYKSLLYLDEGKIGNGLDMALKARGIIEHTNNWCQMAKYSANEGQIYFRINNYSLAKKAFLRELNFLIKCPNNSDTFYQMHLVLSNIGRSYMRLNDFPMALKYYKQSADYILKNKELINNNIEYFNNIMYSINNGISRLFLKQRKFQEALLYAQKSDEYDKNFEKSEVDKYFYYSLYAEIYLGFGNYKKAMQLMPLCDRYSKFLNGNNLLHYYNLQQKIALINNNPTEILNYNIKHQNLKDSLDLANKPLADQNLEIEYQKTQDKLNLEILRKENQLNRIYILMFIGLLFVTAFFLYISRKNLNKKNKLYDRIHNLNLELSANAKNLKRLNTDLEASKEKQKNEALILQQIKLELAYKNDLLAQKRKISNELHDGVSGTLTALKYHITDYKRKYGNKEINNFIEDVEGEIISIHENLRNFLYSLQYNSENTDFELLKYVRQSAVNINKSGSIKVDLSFDENDIKNKLTVFEIRQLDYIVSELFSNAIKHSNAKDIILEIKIVNQNCQFSIIDNGTGFDFSKIKYGLGLNSVHERINQLNGKLEFESDTNTGTKIIGSFDLKKNA